MLGQANVDLSKNGCGLATPTTTVPQDDAVAATVQDVNVLQIRGHKMGEASNHDFGLHLWLGPVTPQVQATALNGDRRDKESQALGFTAVAYLAARPMLDSRYEAHAPEWQSLGVRPRSERGSNRTATGSRGRGRVDAQAERRVWSRARARMRGLGPAECQPPRAAPRCRSWRRRGCRASSRDPLRRRRAHPREGATATPSAPRRRRRSPRAHYNSASDRLARRRRPAR